MPDSLTDTPTRPARTRVGRLDIAQLFAYGTLCGGCLSDKWVGAPDPASIGDWSKMKYRRFIDTIGGWEPFQAILHAAKGVADRHDVSVSNVATRWVLDHDAVAATIIGARLGEAEYMLDNAKLFTLTLDADDHAALEAAFAQTGMIPGDCGDDYRKQPFLTASGDLSHHLDAIPRAHGRAFGDIKPANTLAVVAGLIGGYKVEIEAEAVIGDAP